ncbi:hypothetical protein ASD79_04530 [Caulobacter sp. Root655]|uniref:ATP-binding protein n=1 Tax=Caulobacter sp. Root655 TaxID=1736578 RepID=UPI0006F66868|nr:ATP-binding protein [Caulobacter sp. Root655]KRA66533.1 hypothetical protein ASD79_04530 [Caulobacter sp. Root655]
MRDVSEHAKAVRYERLIEVMEGLDWPVAREPFAMAQKLAVDRLHRLPETVPAYRGLETIVGWRPDTIRTSLQRGRLFREMLELLCEIFAARDTRPDFTAAQKKEAYFQFVMNAVPLDWDRPVEVFTPNPRSIFPFNDATATPIGEADGDLFFNAVRQGMGAPAKDWDIPRFGYGDTLRSRLSKTPADLAPWHVHYIGGRSGSGKTVLLDRIAFDARENGLSVFTCGTAHVDPHTFFERLNGALATAASRVVVLFDDAHRLEARGVSLAELAGMRPPVSGQQVTLVLAANWQTQAHALPLHLAPEERARSLDTLSNLTDGEIQAFVSKICWAERTGVIRSVQCMVPESERAGLLTDSRERLILLALLKLRYARNVREALGEEFLAIGDGKAKEFYAQIAVMDALGCPLPRVALSALLPDAPQAASLLRTMTWLEGDRIHLRHPLLVIPTIDVVCPDVDARPDLLCAILLSLNRGGRAERMVLLEYFTRERISQAIFRFFKYRKDLIKSYMDVLFDNMEEFIQSELGAQLYCHLGIIEKDILLKFEEAAYCFEDALKVDENNVYAAKQLAWALLKAGWEREAEAQARRAVQQHPEERELVSDCAFIMSWCTSEGFEEATRLYRDLMALYPDDEGLRRRWTRHAEAAAVAQASKGAFSDYQYQEMRAPAFIWRVRRHAMKQYKRALFGSLAGALREADVSVGLLEEASLVKMEGSDGALRGLLEANLGRRLYERWYHDQEPIDLAEIERHFREGVRLAPQEPFAHLWLGTFLKEARDDYPGAKAAYEAARAAAKGFRIPDVVEHPMILNNLALLHMDAVYTQRESPAVGLAQARALLVASIARMDESKSRFRWPIDTLARLEGMEREFGVAVGSAEA